MKKRILSTILAMVMVFGMSATVMADDFKECDPLNNELYDVIEYLGDSYEYDLEEDIAEGYNDGYTLVADAEGLDQYYQSIDGQTVNMGADVGYNLGYFIRLGYGYPRSTDIMAVTNPSVLYNFEDCDIINFDDDYYAVLIINKRSEQSSEEPLYASESYYKIRFKAIIPSVQLNGQKIRFDQVPVIEEGRTLVPVRAIFEALGATLTWDEATQTVSAVKDDTEISLKINEKQAQKNDETITLDVPAKIINGRTMVPVRFIADCFGVDTAWDGEYKIVRLTSK